MQHPTKLVFTQKYVQTYNILKKTFPLNQSYLNKCDNSNLRVIITIKF